MKLKLSLMLLILALFLVACSNSNDQTDDLSTDEIKTLVHDFTVRNVTAEAASITSEELIVTEENDEQTVYTLPEDEFFVSIAPFKTETHPCDIHSLTGCQGELIGEDFNVKVEDKTGKVILDEIKQTESNGFIDLWLPRDGVFEVTITQDDKKSVSEITTYEGDNTCITTMQLS